MAGRLCRLVSLWEPHRGVSLSHSSHFTQKGCFHQKCRFTLSSPVYSLCSLLTKFSFLQRVFSQKSGKTFSLSLFQVTEILLPPSSVGRVVPPIQHRQWLDSIIRFSLFRQNPHTFPSPLSEFRSTQGKKNQELCPPIDLRAIARARENCDKLFSNTIFVFVFSIFIVRNKSEERLFGSFCVFSFFYSAFRFSRRPRIFLSFQTDLDCFLSFSF